MSHTRLEPALRVRQILHFAVQEAEHVGLYRLTRDAIANRAQVSPGLVSARLGNMDVVRSRVLEECAQRAWVDLSDGKRPELNHLRVLVQGMAMRHPVALGIPAVLQQVATESVLPAER